MVSILAEQEDDVRKVVIDELVRLHGFPDCFRAQDPSCKVGQHIRLFRLQLGGFFFLKSEVN